jgi:hypothetical protein
MIDTDLSQQLHSLAATVDEPIDLVALHRRISVQRRRRAAVKVGFAGAGVAAVVGGLFVVGHDGSGPAGGGLAASSTAASDAAQPTTALPDCAVVLAGIQTANSTAAAVVPKGPAIDPSPAGDSPEANFKGAVTILTTDGSQITFSADDPGAPPTSGVAVVDEATRWMDGATQLDAAPTVQVGQHVGLATAAGTDGVDRVIFLDIGPISVEADTKPADSKVVPADSTGVDPSGAAAKVVLPGPALPPGPTEKARGTVVGADATSISVTVADASGQEKTFAVDLASTPFYAGDTQCAPGALAVGAEVGVAYHFDDAGAVVGDAVMLIPPHDQP